MKQRKQPKDSAVTITLPVIPDVPPPGAGVLPAGVPDVLCNVRDIFIKIFSSDNHIQLQYTSKFG